MEKKNSDTAINGYQLILASASPRRSQLLDQIGLKFTVCPGRKEEAVSKSAPEEIVAELSAQKAEEIFYSARGKGRESGQLPIAVIGADTVVSLNGKVMGKPKDDKDAAAMLCALQGNTHQVYTGVTVIYDDMGSQDRGAGKTSVRRLQFYECTRVSFYPVTEEEIAAYVATGEPMDKAGAYGIQGQAAAFIQKIDGDYNNVVGLPAGRLYQEMKRKKIL